MLKIGSVLNHMNSITDYWSPKIIAEIGDKYVKLAKFKGDFIWHNHENEDELFYVIKGSFDLHLEEEIITLNKGDYYVVKKGLNHKPVANEECLVMLIEKKNTKHTGDIETDVTKSIEEQL
ncbi:cupin domain-containing protein [Clostridium sp. D2Q-11]|uniref:Cupin domain-containing protein n=1 Tax=Anaeromonas frigoriresistens TaxID=2683708 RepID=A0A942UZU3_9FIRM|nr:cupin domain-containing protein [Anaeromonas frigoriresistens]MBS4537482.1 cupin domain-containing protein [Anaeromonas frigoriresistens]